MIEIKIDNLFVVQNQIDRLGRGLNDNRYLLMKTPARPFLQLTNQDKHLMT